METNYRIKAVINVKDKDLPEALDLYIRSVDENSDTSTSEIRAYIQNKYDDNRKMFFYILYVNNSVVGFAEYGYLPENQIIFIDYICTFPRNHTYFYNFYHMIFEDISDFLRKGNHFIKYIVTELSLKKDSENKYIDTDSNYFRQLLSTEQFKIIKTPYYQPYCNAKHNLEIMDFNIAIKPMINGLFSKTEIDKNFYEAILTDIYINHYVAWYKKFMDSEQVESFFNDLMTKIFKEFTNEVKIEIDDITLVNCILFQNGLCKQLSTENITLRKKQKYCFRQWVFRVGCVLFAVVTGVFCYFDFFDSGVTFACSLLTIVSSTIALIQFIRDLNLF